jgi:hypothetical protein
MITKEQVDAFLDNIIAVGIIKIRNKRISL